MSTSSKIALVAAGNDTTNPYQPYIDGLDALTTLASGFTFINDGITIPPPDPTVFDDIADAIIAFNVAVGLFNDEIRLVDGGTTTGLTATIEGHWNAYWNGAFQNYKNRPTLLSAADGIQADVLAGDDLDPIDPTLTWSAIGSKTWSDESLAEYDVNVTAISDILNTVVDGNVTLVSQVTSEQAKIDSARAAVTALRSPFAVAALAEEEAYDEALLFVNAFAYIKTIESNPDDPKTQEIAAKFSGNLIP